MLFIGQLHLLSFGLFDEPSDAVVAIRVGGSLNVDQLRMLSSARIRALAPRTMNVEISEWRRRTNSGSAAQHHLPL